jgi:hypothetical protein
MYPAIVAALMFVFPIASVAYEVVVGAAPLSLLLIGKWFAFWSVGMRLLLAGSRQIIQPRYTAEVLLSLKSEESFILVRELGFANLAVGILGLGSLFFEPWRSAALLVGGVFYGLAGVNHLLRPHRGKLENIATVSDLWAALVLLAAFAGALASHAAAQTL